MTIEPPEIVEVSSKTVACDGDEGPLGHPRIYLNLSQEGRVDCPYCDRQYVLKSHGSTGDQ